MSVTLMMGGSMEEMGPALDCAIDLTKRMKTTLKALCAMPDPANAAVYITGAETVSIGATAIQSMIEGQKKQVDAYQAFFNEQTEAAGAWLNTSFKSKTGSVASHGAVAASLADAFVISKQATQSNHPLNPVFEHVLMEAGLPLVLAPKQPKVSDTCIIAWDGSALAARAVRMHLPLIASFKKVVIAHNPEKVRHQWAHVCQESKARLSEMLLEARLEVAEADLSGPISAGLLETADSHDASLIVMGAYGHTRIGQMLFGGTTSKLLHDDAAPALALCH